MAVKASVVLDDESLPVRSWRLTSGPGPPRQLDELRHHLKLRAEGAILVLAKSRLQGRILELSLQLLGKVQPVLELLIESLDER